MALSAKILYSPSQLHRSRPGWRTMTTAQKLFIGYGLIVLSYAFLLGIPMAAARAKAPKIGRHLVNCHLSGLMQSSIHFGLAYVVGAVAFSGTLATVGAGLLVAGTACETVGGTLNWRQDVGDQFAENSIGLKANQLSGPLCIIGLGIIVFGVFSRLV